MKFSEIFIYGVAYAHKVVDFIIWHLIKLLELPYVRLQGVIVSGNVEFRGWCHIYKHISSNIKIGSHCVFIYSSSANHVGLNHRCSVSTMREGASIIIGNNVGISSSSITAFSNITIGDNVRIGANCVIMDGDFHLNDSRVSSPRPIKICDNVWLGYGVAVLKGVTIGENTVIGVNSVVTKDIPANSIAVGNPCKVIRSLKNN